MDISVYTAEQDVRLSYYWVWSVTSSRDEVKGNHTTSFRPLFLWARKIAPRAEEGMWQLSLDS